MALFIVLAILLISFVIEQYKAKQWKKSQLKENLKRKYYTDYFGVDRDRETDAARFIGTDINGDRVVRDNHCKIIANLSQSNEEKLFDLQVPKAIERGLRAVELDFLPSERNEYYHQFCLKKKYKDVYTKANYIIIKGSPKRGMDLVHYYYDYQNKKVVCPADGFEKRFNDPYAGQVKNTKSFRQGFSEYVSWDDVLAEIPKLQADIDEYGLNNMQLLDRESEYGIYIHEGGYYAR